MQVSFYTSAQTTIQTHTESRQDNTLANDNNTRSSKQLDINVLLGTGKNVDSMAVFDQLLTEAYQKLSDTFALPPELEAKMSEVKGYNDGRPVTAEKASNNILGFIERRLMLDQADGATQEELASRLEAGLEGFEKGFAQAKEQLEALALFSPEIEADINQTYNLVHQGISSLKEKYLGIAESVPNTTQTSNIRTEGSTSDTQNNISAPDLAASLSAPNSFFAQRNDFSFDLKTRDGDTVTIRANAQEINASKYGQERSSNFSIEINGELDEGELAAINDLLSQVNDLATTFFSGDMNKAFEQALSVGYDYEEIAQFALKLTHTEVQANPTNYQTDNQIPFTQRLDPIRDFAQQLLDTIETAHLANQEEILQQLAERIDIQATDNTKIQTEDKPTIKFSSFVHLVVQAHNESSS
jgi:hypothetical protein